MSPHAGRLVRYSVLLSLLLNATGCLNNGDATGPALEGEEGFARFVYTGSGFDGNFNANGRFSRDSNGYVKRQSFATAIDVNSPPFVYYGIVAAEFGQPDLNNLSITISGRSRGEYGITSFERCAAMIEAGTGNCAAISYDLGLSSDGYYLSSTRSFDLIEGTLLVTSVDNGRIQGTFSGSALPIGNGVASDPDLEDIGVEITGGNFDVPVLSLRQWNGAGQLNPETNSPLQALLRD